MSVECRFLSRREQKKRAFRGRIELHSCNQCSHGELHLIPCDRNPSVEVTQLAEDQYDLVDGVLVSHEGMPGNGDHTLLFNALCALISRL